MKTMKFNTNIKCSGCVANTTPYLNEAVGEDNWEVDIENPSKVLTVVGDYTKEQIIEAVKKAGYKAEPVENV
ncbi:MAG: heavy-metal-associated domain-containing protein [Cyclobacteriaceae bacterium]